MLKARRKCDIMQENVCPSCGEGLYMNLDGLRGTCSRCQREWSVEDIADHVAQDVVDVADPIGPETEVAAPPKRRLLKKRKAQSK